MDVSLRPEVREWLNQESARTGVAPEELAARRIEAQWATATQFPALSSEESTLLAEINTGFPPSFWQRYRQLIALREAETLSPQEQAELISLSDTVEEKNLQRVHRLLALAQLRHVSLESLIADLGLAPVSVGS